MPQVTVIIPTYNWSSVLRYAIQSVLWQTLQDFELWVIGDGCTDDSGEVVASFHDPRVHWHNLPINYGSQYAPNNKGLELAQGEYIAYLGHDDVWHPEHLTSLVETIKANDADGAYALCEAIGPPPQNLKYILGLSPSGQYEHGLHVAPTSFMHKRSIIAEIGGWRDNRTIHLTPDIEFIARGWEHGKKYVPTHQLTAFKFPTPMRKKVYQDRPSHEQAAFVKRIQEESDLRYRELLDVMQTNAAGHFPTVIKWQIVEGMTPGSTTAWLTENRGLSPQAPVEKSAIASVPTHQNLQTLLLTNPMQDITPLSGRQALHLARQIPTDGLLLGLNWHRLEQDAWGLLRWVNTNAELVITNPTGQRQRIRLEVLPGPGVNYQPFTLQIMHKGTTIHTQVVEGHTIFEVDLPIQLGTGQIFTLSTLDGGRSIETDSRIMNFQVRQVAWA